MEEIKYNIIDLEKVELDTDKHYIIQFCSDRFQDQEDLNKFCCHLREQLHKIGVTNVVLLPSDIILKIIED